MIGCRLLQSLRSNRRAGTDVVESVVVNKSLSEPLDHEELARLDEFLLNRIDDETGDRIAAAGGDEGILDASELDRSEEHTSELQSPI